MVLVVLVVIVLVVVVLVQELKGLTQTEAELPQRQALSWVGLAHQSYLQQQ